MAKPRVKVTVDRTAEVKKIVDGFKNDDVLVGIPAVTSEREEVGINNAAILAINEFGLPEHNIPPRPVMEIGIKNAQDEIAEEFKKAAQNALSQGLAALNQYYTRAGIIASNAIKKVINSQEDIDPPSEATLKARQAAGFKGEKALLVTGQMRNAITYVVKGK